MEKTVASEVDAIASSPMPEWAQIALATPSDSNRVEVDGCSVHYLSWGDSDSPPVVLVHGNAAHAEWWRFIAPLLAADYHVLAIDLGGMGDSSHCGRYARERYVDQVMAVAHHAAPGRKPVIVGHSLGGYVTIMTGALHGGRVAGIIAIDSPIDPLGLERYPPMAQFKKQVDVYASRDEALRRFRLIPEQPVGCPFYLDHIARTSVVQVDGGWRWKFDPLAVAHPRPISFTQELLAMRCPAALFIGEFSERIDDISKGHMLGALAARMPVVELANCRHHVMMDEPLSLVAALRTQLANWALQVHG